MGVNNSLFGFTFNLQIPELNKFVEPRSGLAQKLCQNAKGSEDEGGCDLLSTPTTSQNSGPYALKKSDSKIQKMQREEENAVFNHSYDKVRNAAILDKYF